MLDRNISVGVGDCLGKRVTGLGYRPTRPAGGSCDEYRLKHWKTMVATCNETPLRRHHYRWQPRPVTHLPRHSPHLPKHPHCDPYRTRSTPETPTASHGLVMPKIHRTFCCAVCAATRSAHIPYPFPYEPMHPMCSAHISHTFRHIPHPFRTRSVHIPIYPYTSPYIFPHTFHVPHTFTLTIYAGDGNDDWNGDDAVAIIRRSRRNRRSRRKA